MAGQKLIYDLSITVVLLLMDCSFFFIALQIWALEHLLCLSKKGDLRRQKFPRILHWQDVKVGLRQIEVAFERNLVSNTYGQIYELTVIVQNCAIVVIVVVIRLFMI